MKQILCNYSWPSLSLPNKLFILFLLGFWILWLKWGFWTSSFSKTFLGMSNTKWSTVECQTLNDHSNDHKLVSLVKANGNCKPIQSKGFKFC